MTIALLIVLAALMVADTALVLRGLTKGLEIWSPFDQFQVSKSPAVIGWQVGCFALVATVAALIPYSWIVVVLACLHWGAGVLQSLKLLREV